MTPVDPAASAPQETSTQNTLGARTAEAVRTRSPRLVFWVSWVVMSALAGMWALANPMGAAPDEPSHIVRAAAIVRAEPMSDVRTGVWGVELPRVFGITHEMPGCYAFRSEVSASCWPQNFGDLAAEEETTTQAGAYNPLYYTLVGAPALLPPRFGVLYMMRILSAVLCSFCLALGFRSIAEAGLRRWTVAAAAVAVTPMVVFMNSSVNPNAIEASAGIGLWLTLVLALTRPDPRLTSRRWWRAGVLVVLLVNAKAFSPLYLAIIVATAVALAPWSNVVAAVRDRRTWPGLALGTAGAVAAVAWIAHAGAVAGAGIEKFPEMDARRALDSVLRLTSAYVEQMMGRFGWHDTAAPGTVYLWIAAALGVLVVLAVAAARMRQRIVLVALAVLVVALPALMQVPQARYVGLPWQGRYLMAVAVGVPIIAGILLDRAPLGLARPVARNAVGILVVAMSVAQLASFALNLRRYVAGTAAPWFAPVTDPWHPPLPVPVLVCLAVVASAAVVALLLWLAGERVAAPALPAAHEKQLPAQSEVSSSPSR